MALRGAIWIAFVSYAGLAIVLGWRAARRERDEHFWNAGRSLSAPAVGLSISAGFLSVSWSCVYAVQLFYWYGAGALWLITIPWLLALAGVYWLANAYRGLDAFSQPEMVGQRFGTTARRLVAAALAAVFLVWGGAEIYVAASLLAPLLGTSSVFVVLALGAVVATYSALGGFRAVVHTDQVQVGVVVLYLGAMAYLAWVGLALEPAGVMERALGTKSAAPWSAPLSPGGVIVALTFLAYVPGWLFETDLWLRVQAARDARSARRGVAIAALLAVLFVGLVPMFIGTVASGLFPLQDGAFPAVVGVEGDAIFTELVNRYAPPWLAVLVAMGLVAAAMSTIDTCTNVMALSIDADLLARARRPRRRARLVTVACVLAACVFALNTDSLWDIFYLSSGILTTAVAFPVAAVFWPRARPAAVVISSLAGLVVTCLAYFAEVYGPLTQFEPAWLAGSNVGFIVWGVAAAAIGAVAGQIHGATEGIPIRS